VRPEAWVPGWPETHALEDSPEHATTENLIWGFFDMARESSWLDQFRAELLRGLAKWLCCLPTEMHGHPPKGVLGFWTARETVRPNHEVGKSRFRRSTLDQGEPAKGNGWVNC